MKEDGFDNRGICHEIECHSLINDMAVNVLSWMRQFSFFSSFCLCSALATSRKEIQRAVIQDCHAKRFIILPIFIYSPNFALLPYNTLTGLKRNP